MDDWAFRVLFRSLLSFEGTSLGRNDFAHVAVQIDPEQNRVLEPALVRADFERRFQSGTVSIYWGSVAQFLEDLRKRLGRTARPRGCPARG